MSFRQAAAARATSQRQLIGDAAFQTLARNLHDETGIVLSDAKKGLAVSRLSRRLRALGLSDFDAYCGMLRGPHGAAELQEMILLLTTNVTRFFREPHHFEDLRANILPDLLSKARAGGRVRIWSAGCSSGEEPYSIAMMILDASPQATSLDIRILASDINQNVVSAGQTGRYRVSEVDRIAHPLLSKFLEKNTGTVDEFDVTSAVKKMVRFGRLNLQQPWPMQGKFDVIFCRNVVIYFSTETQQALWPRFAEALHEGGHLMIGHSERVTGVATGTLLSSGVTQYQYKPKGAMK